MSDTHIVPIPDFVTFPVSQRIRLGKGSQAGARGHKTERKSSDQIGIRTRISNVQASTLIAAEIIDETKIQPAPLGRQDTQNYHLVLIRDDHPCDHQGAPNGDYLRAQLLLQLDPSRLPDRAGIA